MIMGKPIAHPMAKVLTEYYAVGYKSEILNPILANLKITEPECMEVLEMRFAKKYYHAKIDSEIYISKTCMYTRINKVLDIIQDRYNYRTTRELE